MVAGSSGELGFAPCTRPVIDPGLVLARFALLKKYRLPCIVGLEIDPLTSIQRTGFHYQPLCARCPVEHAAGMKRFRASVQATTSGVSLPMFLGSELSPFPLEVVDVLDAEQILLHRLLPGGRRRGEVHRQQPAALPGPRTRSDSLIIHALDFIDFLRPALRARRTAIPGRPEFYREPPRRMRFGPRP